MERLIFLLTIVCSRQFHDYNPSLPAYSPRDQTDV